MMKKILALVLAACMLLALCACGAGSETTSTTAAGGSGEPAANTGTGVGGTAYPNPLQDVRVRQALWYAIDIDAARPDVPCLYRTQLPAIRRLFSICRYYPSPSKLDSSIDFSSIAEDPDSPIRNAPFPGSFCNIHVFHKNNSTPISERLQEIQLGI